MTDVALEGSGPAAYLDEIRAFQAGRAAGEDATGAFAQYEREARSAFSDERRYAEQLIEVARHVEVQLVGDGTSVIALHVRECSVQRRRQMLIEIAPAPFVPDATRSAMRGTALKLGRAPSLRGLVTIEYLLEPDDRFAFIEANPRLQVEAAFTPTSAPIWCPERIDMPLNHKGSIQP